MAPPAMEPLDIRVARQAAAALQAGLAPNSFSICGIAARGQVPDAIAAAQLFLSAGKIRPSKDRPSSKEFSAEPDKPSCGMHRWTS